MTWHTLGAPPSKAWAEKLRERELAGEHLTLFQRDAWRTALKEPAGEVADRPS